VKLQGQLARLGSRCIGASAMVDKIRVAMGKTHNGGRRGCLISRERNTSERGAMTLSLYRTESKIESEFVWN
jgi:hypothetical protein